VKNAISKLGLNNIPGLEKRQCCLSHKVMSMSGQLADASSRAGESWSERNARSIH